MILAQTNQDLQDFPKHLSYEEFELILQNLDGAKKNQLSDMFWVFKDGLSINFSIINDLNKSHSTWSKGLDIDVVWLSKILFLSSVEGMRSITLMRYRFDSLVKTLHFLASQNVYLIKARDLENYLNYLLMNSIHNNKLWIRPTPLSFNTYCHGIGHIEWIKTIKLYNLPSIGFNTPFANSSIRNVLKNTIETLSSGDLTFRDWVDGGSFNHLTLDYGRFYVEHCIDLFDRNISLAIALKRTLAQASEIARQAGFFVGESNLKSYVVPLIGHFLAGKEINDLTKSMRSKASVQWFSSLQQSALKIFKENLRIISLFDLLTSETELKKLTHDIGLSDPSEAKIEWIKYIVQSRWTQLTYLKSTEIVHLRISEINSLKNFTINEINLEHIYAHVDKSYAQYIKNLEISLPSTSFFQEIGVHKKGTQSTYVLNFLRMIESAGIVKFVSITGWRESEFGFSLKNIHPYHNNDILDQLPCPIRFEVDWIVPKTNGRTLIKREITRNSYETALRLSELVNAGNESPCLYSYNALSKDPRISSDFIKHSVSNLWPHFVKNYKPFKQIILINELKSLKAKAVPSNAEMIRLSYLLECYLNEDWQNIENDTLLNVAFDRSKTEYARVNFFLAHDSRKKLIEEYRKGTLKPEYSKILDVYLSQETKDSIYALRSIEEITPIFTRSVVNEVMADCLYPTPHAFRHMWAESVYRRFDGDVGWMIRSNFKHISMNMWLAYIRNKDNRRQHDRIKRRIISSLLTNYVNKNGVGYAGAMDKFLRRMFLHTNTSNLDQLDALIEQYAYSEIEDIKSNPWGFCILRKRGQSQAKCADQGVPQRHNASPALCLGCTNNLTQEGNIEGILLGISNDLKVLQNIKIPKSFRRASSETVKNAYKQLKKLNIERSLLSEIELALNFAGVP